MNIIDKRKFFAWRRLKVMLDRGAVKMSDNEDWRQPPRGLEQPAK